LAGIYEQHNSLNGYPVPVPVLFSVIETGFLISPLNSLENKYV
jgi:hypothetical protein